MDIQWYPGHMAKARRTLMNEIKLVDVVVEILDARIPVASRNPDIEDILELRPRIYVLNKADLAEEKATRAWSEKLGRQGATLPFVSTASNRKKAAQMISDAAAKEVRRMEQKGVKKTVRALVIGIPNVGKSTFINCVAGGTRARTADRPGVTRGKQWVRVTPYLELLDMPGLLWPKLTPERVALDLAFVGAVKDEIMDTEKLAMALLLRLREREPDCLAARYKLDTLSGEGEELLERISKKRGMILSGGRVDTLRGAQMLLDEFRNGRIGRITLEKPEETIDEGE
ncbi:ribosome biogenesis GTPase YlqF [Gehongia tenuis]|uniref:Ribosome biogenesis GTPase A n=1 Tax=Gehongia tenuis TaxID=2763655 RepID=A0A926D5Y3_9FIRM|nr:ribosome biogenesis GTPase YlqF [Gehongia tenuis]MBC8530985.1 ribosome biogenesis GTPase YlqF [Gehongia tenuis]